MQYISDATYDKEGVRGDIYILLENAQDFDRYLSEAFLTREEFEQEFGIKKETLLKVGLPFTTVDNRLYFLDWYRNDMADIDYTVLNW